MMKFKIKSNIKRKYISLKKSEPHKKENQKKKKGVNYGLSVLKFILSFIVLTSHNFDRKTTKNEYILNFTRERKLHVPSFFIMSFYFMSEHLNSLKVKIFLQRLMRLLIPYIGWPIIIWNINRFLNRKYNKNLPGTYEELKLQLLWAQIYIRPLWFQWELIALTILFYIIIFIFRRHSLFIFQILLLLSYFAQYSGYNYNHFFKNYPYYNKYIYGLFLESLSFAVTGYTLGIYKVIDILQKNKIKTLILSILIYNIIADYNIFINNNGVIYNGINLNIQSMCLIFIFSLFPSDKITNKYISKYLILITSFTGGIYYMHVPIRKYLNYFSDNIEKGTFLGQIMVYCIIYCICFIGNSIFGKTPIKYLFC